MAEAGKNLMFTSYLQLCLLQLVSLSVFLKFKKIYWSFKVCRGKKLFSPVIVPLIPNGTEKPSLMLTT